MRPSRKPRFVLIFLLALCALFVFRYTARMEELSTLQEQIVTMQARVDHARQEQRKLENELAHVSSADYLDQVARKDLDYGLQGEVVVVPVPAHGAPRDHVTGGMLVQEQLGELDAGEAFNPRDLPVWQQWVIFFVPESGATR